MRVYVQGWGSGWRDYEIESLERLRGTLAEAGARTDGFETFMAPDGAAEAELVSTMAKADTAGFTGVPHYVFDDTASGPRTRPLRPGTSRAYPGKVRRGGAGPLARGAPGSLTRLARHPREALVR